MSDEPCPECGAPLGGRAGCQTVFDEMSARAYADPAQFGVMHDLVVDAYSMQHPNEYGRSAKSYAAHLSRLCCALELGAEPEVYAAIPRWLSGATAPPKPEVLSRRGARTIADARGAGTREEHGRQVQEWAESVWAAYASQHELAREWVRSARATPKPRS
jgi:uncharacterized protein DUF5946